MILAHSIEVLDVLTRRITLEVAELSLIESINSVTSKLDTPIKIERYTAMCVRPDLLQISIENLIRNNLAEFAKQSGLQIVARRSVEVEPLKEGSSVQFSCIIAVFPTPTISSYESIEISPPSRRITDLDVDDAIQLLRRGESSLIETNHVYKSESGDQLHLEFSVTIGGIPSKQKLISFSFNHNIFPAEVEQALLEKSAGDEISVPIRFDENDPVDAYKAKVAIYQIKILKVLKNKLPKLDNEFVKKLNIPEIQTVETLRNWVRDHLEFEGQLAKLSASQSRVLDALLELNYFEVPFELVDDEIRAILLDRGLLTSAPEGVSRDDLSKYRERFGREALHRVRAQILLDRVALQENLLATEADLKLDMPENPDILSKILDIQRTKALNFLMGRAKIKQAPTMAEVSQAANYD